MNAVITVSYLAILGLVQIASIDYRAKTAEIQRGYDKKGKWEKVKNAFKTAVTEPYHYLY